MNGGIRENEWSCVQKEGRGSDTLMGWGFFSGFHTNN